MSYYRQTDPRQLVWQLMSDIQDLQRQLEVLIDQYLCDLDDGYDWIRVERREEE